MATNRLLTLDSLRGIAATMVLLYHYFYRYNKVYSHEEIPVNWAHSGSLGVELFFMISGFVIFWTLTKIQKPLDFIVYRFSRLYPVYWCSVLLTFIIVWHFSLPGREVSLVSGLVNMTMIQEMLRFPHVDGVYWTLTVELLFYFWIYVAYLTRLLGKIEIIGVVTIVVSVIHSLGWIEISEVLYKVMILKYLSFFIIGICCFNLKYGRKTNLTMPVLFVSMFAPLVIFPLKYFPVFAACYILFGLGVFGNTRLLVLKPLVFLGSISYALYLVHQNIGYVIINLFYDNQWPPYAGIAMATMVSIALATLLTILIEKPSTRYIREKYKASVKMQWISEWMFVSKKSD